MALNDYLTPADKALRKLKYKDLQRECIVRGMSFEDLVEADIWRLQSYFKKHYYDAKDSDKLDEFDRWFEGEMTLEGKGTDNPEHAWMHHPSLRLGFTQGEDEQGNSIGHLKPRKFKKVKKKAKRVKLKELGGIIGGTKKAMTFALAIKGNSLSRVQKKVKKAFPEAQDKSIRIWYNKAIKLKK